MSMALARSSRRRLRPEPNCVVLGGVAIGENAKIGAGAVVTRNVPAGARMVGPQAQPIPRKDQSGRRSSTGNIR